MAPEDQEYTTFIMHQGVYYYTVMPFRLKNVGATIQRIVNKMFAHQIERNMEVYGNNMIVKSKFTQTHLADLVEAFMTVKKFGMHLNPIKCTLDVILERFLGFIIHEPQEDSRHHQYAIPPLSKGGVAPNWETSCSCSILVPIKGQMSSFFSSSE